MIAFAAIEWWGEAILNESWRDVYTIAGFAVTFIGFAITLVQLRKTQSAAMAAEIAAKNTLEESRFAFQKFAVALAHRFVNEAKIHVDYKAWEIAFVRLSDLTDQVNQLALHDGTWATFSEELRVWSVTCSRLKSSELKRFPEKEKWLEFCSRIEAKLNQMLAPFPGVKGRENDLRQ